MIFVCPLCGRESGVTHGDQVWEEETCRECLVIEGVTMRELARVGPEEEGEEGAAEGAD